MRSAMRQHSVRNVWPRDQANRVRPRDPGSANTVNILERSPSTPHRASSALIGCSLPCVRLNKLRWSYLSLAATDRGTPDWLPRGTRDFQEPRAPREMSRVLGNVTCNLHFCSEYAYIAAFEGSRSTNNFNVNLFAKKLQKFPTARAWSWDRLSLPTLTRTISCNYELSLLKQE